MAPFVFIGFLIGPSRNLELGDLLWPVLSWAAALAASAAVALWAWGGAVAHQAQVKLSGPPRASSLLAGVMAGLVIGVVFIGSVLHLI